MTNDLILWTYEGKTVLGTNICLIFNFTVIYMFFYIYVCVKAETAGEEKV